MAQSGDSKASTSGDVPHIENFNRPASLPLLTVKKPRCHPKWFFPYEGLLLRLNLIYRATML